MRSPRVTRHIRRLLCVLGSFDAFFPITGKTRLEDLDLPSQHSRGAGGGVSLQSRLGAGHVHTSCWSRSDWVQATAWGPGESKLTL